MTRPNRTARVAIVIVAAASATSLSACAKGARLPGGVYAGSTSTNKAITFLVADTPKINRKKGHWHPNREVVVRDHHHHLVVSLQCTPRDHGDELHCTLRTPNHHEAIDLMRL